MLRILCPARCCSERKWIFKVLLSEFLGLEYSIEINDGNNVRIEGDGKILDLSDIFFTKAEKNWLTKESLPQQPLKYWDIQQLKIPVNLSETRIPIIFGEPHVEVSANTAKLGLDIFGSAFFMLSRYEEAVATHCDKFDRFPASASIAWQEGFLERPIVNEYLEILWCVIKHLWPGLNRKHRSPRTLVSCDVDVPYAPGTKDIMKLARQMGGDLAHRRNPLQAIRTGLNYFHVNSRGDYTFDPFLNKFDWMMDLNEKSDNKMAFYFLSDHSDSTIDGCYSIHEPVVQQLLQKISARGHEIGLHFSYNTYQDGQQTLKEADIMRKVLREAFTPQAALGSRQHYLRWRTPITARNLEAAGISYDTTLSFAEYAGFRCGTCYEYPFYDIVERRELNLRERPLIIMDLSVFGYMGRSYGDDGFEVFNRLKQRCFQFDGDFTMLWHNHQFPNKCSMEFYEKIIQRQERAPC